MPDQYFINISCVLINKKIIMNFNIKFVMFLAVLEVFLDFIRIYILHSNALKS